MNTKQIDGILSQFERLGKHEVGKLCRIKEGVENYEPEVIAFIDAGVEANIVDRLPRLDDIHQSFVFVTMLNAVFKQQNEPCSTNDAISNFLDPAMRRSFAIKHVPLI